MNWASWEHQYRSIVDRFDYDTAREIEALESGRVAAQINPNVLKGDGAISELSGLVRERCIVTGAGPSLERDIPIARRLGSYSNYTLVASDGSCALLGREGILPDIIVTDLDGDVDKEREMNSNGALMVIHFHGDNFRRAEKYVRTLKGMVVITTQAGPTENTFNFGGYTDGDRAVLLCEEFGAKQVVLAGFDFGSAKDPEGNAEKLLEAKRIVDDAGTRGMEILKPHYESF